MCAMSNQDRADELTAATTAALRGVIAESKYQSTTKIAEELGMSYSTLTRNISGANTIKLATVYRILDLLGITPAEFGERVMDAVKRQR